MISFKGLSSGKDKQPQQPAQAQQANPQTPDQKENIFGQSLNVGQVKKSEKEAYLESKNKKKAYFSLLISLTALAAYSIFFFYGHVTAYLEAPAEIRSLNAENAEYAEVIIPSLEEQKNLHKSAYDQEFEDTLAALDVVFPEGIDKLGIVRLFESFASEVDANFPPFEFTSITLGAPVQQDDYVITPVSTSIHSSLAGFDRFLSLVDQSGKIYTGEGDDKQISNTLIRLMSISNISVKYRGVNPETGRDDGVDFSVKLDVYSRPGSES